MPPKLHLGTASWSSEDWLGKFYPQGMKPGAFLGHYATQFDTVEVDSSFYRAPTRALVAKWKRDVPESFRFAFKVPQSITHEKVLNGAEKEFESFVGTLQELGPRLGFVCFQFGYFNKQSLCPSVEEFLGRLEPFLKNAPKGPKYAVEIRNPRWIDEPLLDALRRHDVAYVLTEQEWMPKITDLWKKFGKDLITSDFAYIRLLGERKRIEAMTKTFDKLVIDRTAETEAWVPIIQNLLKQKIDVWTYFNNHFGGYAPGSIELFQKIWKEATR